MGPAPRTFLLLSVAIAAVVVCVLAFAGGGDDDGPGETAAAAERALVGAQQLRGEDPRGAAALAAAGDMLDPTPASLQAMLTVAAGQTGIARTIDTGDDAVTAAAWIDEVVVTAAAGRLRTWSAVDGASLGEVGTETTLVELAAGTAATQLIGADAAGRLFAVDLSEPSEPALRPLAGGRRSPTRLVALAISVFHGDALALTANGVLERTDLATGALRERRSLRTAGGELPWDRGGAPRLAAAHIEAGVYAADDERLIVAAEDGAVARIDVARWHGQTVIAREVAPGRVVSVAGGGYAHDTDVAVGATAGLVLADSEGLAEWPAVERQIPQPAVAMGDGGTWVGGPAGVEWRSDTPGMPPSAAGLPVERLVPASDGTGGGVLAVHPGGVVSLLGKPGTGMAGPETSSSPIATFGPSGELLTAEGFGPNDVEELAARWVGTRRDAQGVAVDHPVVRSYRPDPAWWSEEDVVRGLYVHAAVLGEQLLAASGQDPTGSAVVLVWDARTGRPLRRLPLSTGGSEPDGPSIATSIALLPRRRLIAVYSVVQEMVSLWSTDDWRAVAGVPVGRAGGLSVSPDESTLVITSLPDETDAASSAKRRTRLVFIDVEERRIDHQVDGGGAYMAAWSPDGTRLAAMEPGILRIRSADGRRPLRAIEIDDGEPNALAWRPDGALIAVGLERLGGGLAFADPETGEVSTAVPIEADRRVADLSWRGDGRRLAVATAHYDDDGDVAPDAVQIWDVGRDALRRRMCQLAGAGIDRARWREAVSAQLPLRSPCPPAAGAPRSARGLAAIGQPAIALHAGSEVSVVDDRGGLARVGGIAADSPAEQVDLLWRDETFGWLSDGEAHLLAPGDDRVRSWFCSCAGGALTAAGLKTLTADGTRIVDFPAGAGTPRATEVLGLGSYPRLIGVTGPDAIVAAHTEKLPVRGTPNSLFRVTPEGRAELLPVKLPGIVLGRPGALTPDGETLAFVVGGDGPVCYATSTVGLLERRRGRWSARFPEIPGAGDDEPVVVRSLHVRADGVLEAAIAPLGCDEDGVTPPTPPDAVRHELRDGRWVATGDRGFDIQRGDAGLATLTARSRTYPVSADLELEPAAGGPVARLRIGAGRMAVRP